MRQWGSQAAFYAGNSLSTTLPGGPVLSATFIYRQHESGCDSRLASWQLVMSGALQIISLTLLGLGSAFFLGAKHNPFSLVFTLAGFIMLIAAGPGGGRHVPTCSTESACGFCRGSTICARKPSDNGLAEVA